MTIPDFFTRADFPPLVGEVAAVGGQGISLGDIEGIFKFAQRVQDNITAIADQLTRLRAVETPAVGAPAAGASTVQVLTVDEPVDQLVAKKSEEPMPEVETGTERPGADAGKITAKKIFGVALGALNKVPDATTVGELKAQAKMFKTVVLEEIQKEIDRMQSIE